MNKFGAGQNQEGKVRDLLFKTKPLFSNQVQNTSLIMNFQNSNNFTDPH